MSARTDETGKQQAEEPMSVAMADQPVVVGIDGTGDGLVAARYAATLAEQLGRSLVLMHAYRHSAAINPLLPLADPSSARRATAAVAYAPYSVTFNREMMRSAGEHALRLAQLEALDGHPDLVTRTKLVAGSPAKALIEASGNAAALVLSRSKLGDVERVLAGSVGSAVVTHADSPVIVVPCDWNPADAPHRVVIGIAGADTEVAAVDFAFDFAARADCRLVVAHADHGLDQVYQGNPVLEGQAASLHDADLRMIAEAVSGWSERHPQVAVEQIVSAQRPVDMLLRESQSAMLVVVAARARGGFAGLVLGSTARAVAMHGRCPVAVVRQTSAA
jgi:nucleotide-binding universal stress UspA family protein